MKISRYKVKSFLQRGFAAENRLIDVARSLRNGGVTWVRRVRHAGYKQDQVGIDILIFISPLEGDEHIKVPVQVKSSYKGLKKYCAKYPESIVAGVPVVVVNDNYTDDDLRNFLMEKLKFIRESRMNFHEFFSAKKDQIAGFSAARQESALRFTMGSCME